MKQGKHPDKPNRREIHQELTCASAGKGSPVSGRIPFLFRNGTCEFGVHSSVTQEDLFL